MKGVGTTMKKQKSGKETGTVVVQKPYRVRQREKNRSLPGLTVRRSAGKGFLSWLFGG